MQPLQEKLRQLVTRESLVTFFLDDLARDIVVTCHKWYCSRDVNASPLGQDAHSSQYYGKKIMYLAK